MDNTQAKIFVIGLPRTGTTSLCASFLSLGYTVAHTAYTDHAFQSAKVIADTPIFYAYPKLDLLYPEAKYLYLTRDLASWVPSIKTLLNRMYKNVVSDSGGFNPMIKEAYCEVFSPFTWENINNDDFLRACYKQHEEKIFRYFSSRESDLLTLNLASEKAWPQFCNFLGESNQGKGFPHLNVNGKITAWNDIRHPLKIPSTHNGRIDKRSYK